MAAFVVVAATSRTGGPRLSSRGAICGPPVIASCLPRPHARLVDAGTHMSLRREAVGEPGRLRVAAIAAVAVVGAFVTTNFVAPAQIAHAFTIQSEPLRFSQSLLNDKPEQEKMLHVRWDRHSQDSTTETVVLFENNIDEVVDLFCKFATSVRTQLSSTCAGYKMWDAPHTDLMPVIRLNLG